MVFKCQEDSFLQVFTSKVTSCEPGELKLKEVKKPLKGFNVICEDTVLFPEGGGQPSDHGFLNEKEVRSVIRKGPQAVHFIECQEVPFSVGDEVKQVVDWERRVDHMQQHSGQHLITALFEQLYNYDTKAWWLGTETSYIDLEGKLLTQEEVNAVEKKCNEIISEAIPVKVSVYNKNELTPEEIAKYTRGLPDDVGDKLRIVSIGELDSNMCCGTHIKNTSQLQIIKFLNIEKAKGKILLHFLVGNRVLNKLTDCFNRELKLNLLLNGGPHSHIELITKLQTNYKSTKKQLEKCLKDIALQEAEKLSSLEPKPKFYFNHRIGLEAEFLSIFLREVIDVENVFLFITFDESGGKGKLYLQGHPNDIKNLGPTICEILEGKGNVKNNKFNGKINNFTKIPECERKIINYFENK